MSEEQKQQEGTKTFTQEDVDRIVGERLSRTKAQFIDYDDLKKFKEDHSKQEETLKQQDLVRQKKYEEAEGSYKKQLSERDSIIQQKEQYLNDMVISQAISSAAMKHNGFIEETVALVKGAITLKDGVAIMKVKDSNGIEKEVSVEEGLKTFYASRPYLVKANGQGGSGTPPAGGTGGAGGGGDDLMTLNNQYWQALQSGNRKLASELKAKMHPLMKGNRNAI